MTKNNEDILNTIQNREESIRSRSFCYREGRLYFTRQLERRIFFGGTLLMLFWGVLEKLGVL